MPIERNVDPVQLRSMREAAGLSLSEAAKQLKTTDRFLFAAETGHAKWAENDPDYDALISRMNEVYALGTR